MAYDIVVAGVKLEADAEPVQRDKYVANNVQVPVHQGSRSLSTNTPQA